MGATQCCTTVEKTVPDQATLPKSEQDDSKESNPPIGLSHQASNGETKSSPKVKGLAHIKEAVQKHMNNLKEFRSWLKRHFKSPAEAWEVIAADVPEDGLLQQDLFVKKMKELGFEGNAGALFKVIDEDGTGVTLQQFKQILSSQKKGNSFMELVEQAVANKDKFQDGAEDAAVAPLGPPRRGSKEASGRGASKEQEGRPSIDGGDRSSSPRERSRSQKRDSSPKPSKRDSSPKGRQSSPKGDRALRRRASEGDATANDPKAEGNNPSFSRVNSVSVQPTALRGNSKGSLASMSTASSYFHSSPTNQAGAQVKKKGSGSTQALA